MMDIYQACRQDGKSDRLEVALHSLDLRKGSVMRTAYLRWILPVLVLLLMATALVIVPAVMSHAAGTQTSTTPPTIQQATPTPTHTNPSGVASPNVYWHN